MAKSKNAPKSRRIHGQAAIKEPSALTRRLLGQAAMEFLMTYGWAILIMLVVIAVLFYLGVFSPSTSSTKSCVLPPGFSCYEFDMDSSGNIYLDIGQATGKTITVTGIGCAPSSPNATLNPNVQIPTGSHAIVTIGGTNCSGATNSVFKGKLLIQYTISGSSGTRSVTGDVSAPLIGNSSTWGSGSYSGGSFLYRRPVTVNTGVSSDLTDFPAYFILNTNSLISAGKMNNSCKDLRVLDSTMSSLLDYEIENNTCNTTSTVVWFRVPGTKGTNNYIAYAYYGNNSTSDAQNKAGVWRNGFVAVYHMADTSDSAGANTCSLAGVGTVYNSSGKIGGAQSFNTNGYFDCGASSVFDLNTSLTLEAWGYPTSLPPDFGSWRALVGKLGGALWNGYYLGVTSHSPETEKAFVFGKNWSGAVYTLYFGSAYGGLNAWTHVAGKYDGVNITIYTNGIQRSTKSVAGGLNLSTNSLKIGAANGFSYFNGSIDEVRVTNLVRTEDWIAAEYGQTYSVGSEVVN